MPCSHCGTDQEVHQHHIRHIRKRAYKLIPEAESYQKITDCSEGSTLFPSAFGLRRERSLRNRKQIPLCSDCHLLLVQGGKYDGPRLIKMAPVVKLIDNRILHLESFVKPGREYHAKTHIEKGWKPLISQINLIPKNSWNKI